MNYAVDNEEIVNTILSGFGEPRGQPVAPGINGFNDSIEPYEQDIGTAESLVEESGYGGVEIELVAPSGRYLNDADVGETVADQINQLDNVDCEANIVDFGVVSDANQAGVEPDEYGDTWEIPFYLIGWGLSPATLTTVSRASLRSLTTRTGRSTTKNSATQFSRASRSRIPTSDECNSRRSTSSPTRRPCLLHTQESIYGVRDDIQWDPREDETVYIWEMER